MPRLRLILEEDNATLYEQTFALVGDLDTLDGIDEAVEQFRLQALPPVEKTLMEQAQERQVALKKKKATSAMEPDLSPSPRDRDSSS